MYYYVSQKCSWQQLTLIINNGTNSPKGDFVKNDENGTSFSFSYQKAEKPQEPGAPPVRVAARAVQVDLHGDLPHVGQGVRVQPVGDGAELGPLHVHLAGKTFWTYIYLFTELGTFGIF